MFGNREVKDKERLLRVRVCSEEYGEGLDRKVINEKCTMIICPSPHCHIHILIHTIHTHTNYLYLLLRVLLTHALVNYFE